jgi:hypothetical protein
MPANSRVFLKPFIGGLNTEGSDTDDMVLNTSDELNCTILPEQMRGRRYGFNIEKDGKWIDTDVTENLTGSVYYWKNVAKTDLDILVCRLGSKLYFFDAAIKPITDSEPLGSVDLKEYIIDDNNFYKEKFGFAVGDGKLTVVNRWMQPVRIIYNVNSDELATEERFVVDSFTLSIRDTEGVIDSWGVKSAQKLIEEQNEEPTKAKTDPTWTITDSGVSKIYIPYCESDGDCYLKRKRKGVSSKLVTVGPLTKAAVGTETHVFWDDKDIGVYQTGNDVYGGSKEHYYNLLNQGWTEGDLDKFSQAMSTAGITAIWPDNTMAVSVGRDKTGAYNTGDVVYTYLGNTQQPRGHFILDYFTMNRSEVSGIWDFKNAATAEYSYQNTWVHSRSLRGVMISNHSTTVENSKGKVARILLRWTKLYRKSAKKASDLHWRGNIEIKVYGLLGDTWNYITTRQAASTDGASSKDPLTVNLEFDPTQQSEYDKFRVDVRYYNGNGTPDYPQPLGVTVKIAVFSNDAGTGDYFNIQGDSSRITDVAYMSGKYFYLCKDSVLFSQTVGEDGSGFDLCYQEADPTSTEVSDVVTTDGGYVKFNTMGRGVALKTFNRGVLVFGRDVVYGLISPLESRFTATDYDILELSRAGLISAESVVSTTQQVYYWSPTGIYTIGVNPETGSTIFAQSISLNTIQTFYNNLPQFSKEHCKGVYDYTTNRIYWYYPTNVEHLNNLNGCLVYDLTYNCFMPQSITEDEIYNTGFLEYMNLDAAEVSQSYEIEPTYYLRAGGSRVSAGGDRVLVSDETTTDYHRWTSVQHLIAKRVNNEYKFSVGDFNDREFHDWEYKDFSSYIISRPITLGDTYFNKQTPVMQTLFKRTEEYKLKKKNADIEQALYNFTAIYDKQRSDYHNYRYMDSYLYQSGKIESAQAILNFKNYPEGFHIHNITVAIYGKKEDGTSETVGYVDKYYSIDLGGTICTVDVDLNQEHLDDSYKSFHIHVVVSTANVVTPLYLDYEIPTNFKVLLRRTDLSEPLFRGFEEIAYQGSMVLEQGSSTRYQGFIDTVEGHLTNASVTVNPLINSWSFYPNVIHWEAAAHFVKNTGYVSGITGTVTDVSNTISGQANDGDAYNKYGIFVDGFRITSGSGGLAFIMVDYDFSLMVPKFEEFSYITYADYTTPSGAIIRMRWGWSVNPLSNRWDMMQNGYRPQKDFLHDDYVESRMHIRGRGKAFQVEIRNDENKDFRLTGLNIITRSPQ